MRALVVGLAAMLAAVGFCERNPARAQDAASPPQLMYLSGADIWHTGAFVHGGLLWSPQGLYSEGFTLKLLAGWGNYRYLSGALGGVEVDGAILLGSIMPGWRFKAGKFELTAYGGLDLQNHRVSPYDPGNRLIGTHGGMRAGADVWYELIPSAMMLHGNVSVSTIGPDYWLRGATGWRLFDAVWAGPEAQALGGPNYDQFRIGAHLTSFKAAGFEWSAGVGYAWDSDRRDGLYARLGVLARR